MTYSLFERRETDSFFLLPLHRIIKQDSRAQDVHLPIVEDANSWQEAAVRVAERVWEEEAEDETAGNGEGAHDCKEPEPARLAAHAAHVEDTVCEQLGGGLAELVAEVEDHNTLGGFGARVPCCGCIVVSR